jgi:4-alpha-glucanotransferase
MGKLKLAIGLHNHQPVGNFDSVFEETHQLAYQPFINLLEKYPNIRLSLHQSGILWEWQEKHHPEYFEMVRKLVKRGQIELMTGGYYEPIMPSIPDNDKLGQIAQLTDYLKSHFGVSCDGLWLAERVWEPHLPKILNQAGVKYLPLDDTHFLYAGLEPESLNGVYITEEAGHDLRLLPIQKKLRYLIPFGTVEKIVEELKKQAERNGRGVAIYADDGEKFGGWPKTNKHCYEDRWLEKFFDAVGENSDWLEVCPLGEVASDKPIGRVYLPTASYAEMLHWSLPAKAFVEYEDFEHWLTENKKLEKYGRFVRGGHWRGFLAKYDESNLMHKKMLAVSNKLENFAAANPHETDKIEAAKKHLYAGQCNCPYWHGVFGGLYLPHLRTAIFENLLAAEKILMKPSAGVTVEKCDLDCDGSDEVMVTSAKFSAVFKPSSGGIMVELNSFDGLFNLTDTLRRRTEGYHRKLAEAQLEGAVNANGTASIHDLVLTKEAGLNKLLAEDKYWRRCFIDHFIPGDTDITKFLNGQYKEEGDFVQGEYEYVAHSAGSISMRRKGMVQCADGAHRVTIEKRFYFEDKSDVISVNYTIVADDGNIDNLRLAIENNFSFQAGHAHDRYTMFNNGRKVGTHLDSIITEPNCRMITVQDDWRKMAVALACDREAEIYQMPIFTISLSEGGFEKVYQGTTFLNIFNISLKKGIPLELTFLLFAGMTDKMPKRFINIHSEAVA